MSRKLERILICIVSGWQILTGAITAGIYLFNISDTFGADPSTSMGNTFVFTHGMAYVIFGIINIILTYKVVIDNSIQKRMIIFWVISALIFYLLADYVSLTFLVLAIVITLSKNKPIKLSASQ